MIYVGNGSTGGSVPVDSNSYLLGDTVTVLDNTGTLTLGGNNFSGWNTSIDATGTNYSSGSNLIIDTTNNTLNAVWSSTNFTVSFNSQVGSPVMGTTADYNSTITEPTAPTMVNYTFAGWYKEAGFINLWNFAADKVIANTTLYAKWTIIVAFNSQGGSPIPNTDVTYNSLITAPTAPTKTGYTFGGWYKEALCINAWNIATAPVTMNTILYAKWTVSNPVITFNSQDGSTVTNGTASYNGLITEPTAPTKTGYTFSGWYKEATCTTAWNFATDTVTVDATLYAKWTINSFAVTYNTQGGSTVTGTTVNYNSLLTAPTAPTFTGNTFGGWYKDAGFGNLWNFATDKVLANTALYAKWTIVTNPGPIGGGGGPIGGGGFPGPVTNFTFTFDSQGGSAVTNMTSDINGLISAPVAPTKAGYTFANWYKEAGYINTWVFTTDKATADTTLYAKWTPGTSSANIQRLAGLNRIDTSIAIAKQQYTDIAPESVVLATANNFADALAGSGIAYKYNAPLLLVNKTVNDSKGVLDYITTLLGKNKNIYILGGVGVISKEISDYLTQQGYKIIRLGGVDRYDTNQQIVNYLNAPKGTSIVIATGSNFADALSISSIADINGYPILLNTKENLSASVSAAITNIQPTTVYLIGGTGVLSANIETQVKNLNGKVTIIRLGGNNRYDTSMKIMEHFNLTTTTVAVATGIDFPDALSGSVLAARKNSSVLLVDNKDVTLQKTLINKQKITNIIVFGGEGVVSNSIATSLVQK